MSRLVESQFHINEPLPPPKLSYHPVELSPSMQRIFHRYDQILEGREIEPLSKLPSYFQLLMMRDFPDPDLFGPVLFATQKNSHQGDIQRAILTDKLAELDPEPVLPSVPGFINTSNPEAWAPTPWLHDGCPELWLSVKVRGSGMGIARAIGDSFLSQFTVTDLLLYGEGFRFIDQQLSFENILNRHQTWKNSREAAQNYDWMYYGSMFGPILAQPLDPTHTRFLKPPVPVLAAGPDSSLGRLIEAPIRLQGGGYQYLFVSGCGCFSSNPLRNEHYAIIQTRQNEKTGLFEYQGQDRTSFSDSLVLASTPWFFIPGHPAIFRGHDDSDETATCLFAAIPWFRDQTEQIIAPETPDNRTRYLFKTKLKLIDGWWQIDKSVEVPAISAPTYNLPATP